MKRIRKTTLTILIMTMFVSLLGVNHIRAEHSHTGYTAITSLPSTPGSYYLESDINITTTWIVPEGTVNLCLNGKDLIFSGVTESDTQGSVIIVRSGSTLNLYDCTGGGKITGGKGINQSGNLLGAGVYVNGGTFNMYSGTISGNGADTTQLAYGAGVEVTNNGNFNMHDGTISGNLIGYGAGAGVNVESGGVFNMYDGEITNNTAAEKASGVSLLTNGTFNLYGGSITENKASYSDAKGGGVYVQSDAYFNICSDSSDSVITITNNKTNGTSRDDNVYLANNKININGSINSNSLIGLNMNSPDFFTSGFDGKASTGNFSSDDPQYVVKTGTDSGKTEARLIIPSSHVHSFTYTADGASIYADCSKTDCPLPSGRISITLSQSNYEYDGTAHKVSITNLEDFNNETDLNVSTGDVKYYNGTAELSEAPKDQGTYKAELTVGTTGNQATASIEYDITPKEVTLDWKDTSFTYDGKEHCPTATAGGLISGDTCTVTVAGAQSAVGTHTAKATALSNSNYKLPSDKTVKFTISEKTTPTPEPDKDKESDQKKISTYVAPRTGID